MITRLQNQQFFNPIRDHIRLSFEQCGEDDYVSQIFERLNGFLDRRKSRAIVFVRSRKKAEKFSDEFNQKVRHAKTDMRASYFHAGMDAEDRSSTYEEYKRGNVSVLFATKAFGMGMDIPNIHYVYHLEPSSSFEDYLQEVGRAGRNQEELIKAGFSMQENPIQAICFYHKEAFAQIRDLQQQSQFNWSTLKDVFAIINSYYSQFRELKPSSQSLPLALNLLDTHPDYGGNADITLRLSMFWLEKLNRYEFTYYVPSFLTFSNKYFEQCGAVMPKKEVEVDPVLRSFGRRLSELPAEVGQHEKLYSLIYGVWRDKFQGAENTQVDINDLLKLVKSVSVGEVYRWIITAQEAGVVELVHKIRIRPTHSKGEELLAYGNHRSRNIEFPTISAVVNFARNIIKEIRPFTRKSYNTEYLRHVVQEMAMEYFSINQYHWAAWDRIDEQKQAIKESMLKNDRSDFVRKRAKNIFLLLRALPKVKVENTIDPETNDVIYTIYNNQKIETTIDNWLRNFEKDLYKFLDYYCRHVTKSGDVFNVIDMIIASGISCKELAYMENILIFLRRMGYIRYSGGLTPMSILATLKSTDPIQETDKDSVDAKAFTEFTETIRLRKLRLLVLDTFAKLKAESHQVFIERYFQCNTSAEIVSLISEFLEEKDENILRAFREEALTAEEGKLNSEQRAVYDAPINENISVIAGPGSGKTHTLTLRVARLIQRENIAPSRILVLAYNRAVVSELKARLGKLFAQLGYNRLTYGLKVFTFHGLAKYCLQDQASNSDIKEWEHHLELALQQNRGLVRNRLGPINYIFVDEFQDVTQLRLNILKHLFTGGGTTYLTVIGDPNQSIYGFDRFPDHPRGPLPYYERFNSLFNPNIYTLQNNYRSLPAIIHTSQNWLTNSQSACFNIGTLQAVRPQPPSLSSPTVERFPVENPIAAKWADRLQQLINEQCYTRIAVMTRTTEEIYRAYEHISALSLRGYQVRIQGEAGDFIRSREASHFVNQYIQSASLPITNNFFENFERQKADVLLKRRNWDVYLLDIFHALLREYDQQRGDEDTYSDLLDYLKELTGKDDGQLHQLYQKWKDTLGFQTRWEVILTTMHRVKGLEFEAVMLLPSYADLPFQEGDSLSESEEEEVYDEEARLRYVAFTRAKDKLIYYESSRERSLGLRTTYTNPSSAGLGSPVRTGIDKYIIFSLAKMEIQQFLIGTARSGDKVNLSLSQQGNWTVKQGNRYLGVLSSGNLKRRRELQGIHHVQVLKGFYISHFVQYSLAESLQYDEDNGTLFTKKWDEYCERQGWILIPDFSGYGR